MIADKKPQMIADKKSQMSADVLSVVILYLLICDNLCFNAEAASQNPFKIPDIKQRLAEIKLLEEQQKQQETEIEIKPVVQPPYLNVEGLIWGGPQPQAIINGSVLNVGDEISNAKVKHISKNGVVITYQGTDFTLNITGGVSR